MKGMIGSLFRHFLGNHPVGPYDGGDKEIFILLRTQMRLSFLLTLVRKCALQDLCPTERVALVD